MTLYDCVFIYAAFALAGEGKQGVDYCQQVCLLLSTVRAAVVNRLLTVVNTLFSS